MEGIDILCYFLQKTEKDARIGPVHISLYTAILRCWCEQGQNFAITVTGKKLMKGAKISSETTYHRAIHDLNEFGYIVYRRTFSRWEASKVMLVTAWN